MSEVILIPRSFDTKPGWMPSVNTQQEIVRPHVRCICGKWTNIGNHHIHKDGTVTASYYHTQDNGCGWHVMIKLQDWIGLEFLPGQDKPNV